jgi:hypothetical protein
MNIRTIVVFTATGVAGSVIPAAAAAGAKDGDPVIEIQDITSGGAVGQFFGSSLVSGPANANLSLVELIANAGIAGHTCIALIGVGPNP